jgi:hypothetical protein
MIDLHARLWAGEALVVRSYFESPRRTRASDLVWIERQAFKELVDGVLAMRARGERAETVAAELAHYRVFTDLHASLRGPDDAPIDGDALQRCGDWPENAALRALRAAHIERHGGLGQRALRFTEGGCATLFAEGAKLRGRGGGDDAIAAACERILEDERGHMLEGLRGIEREARSNAEWSTFGAIGAEQLRARIRMRNAQFGHLLSPERVAALCAGACEPLAFDFEEAARVAEAAPVTVLSIDGGQTAG